MRGLASGGNYFCSEFILMVIHSAHFVESNSRNFSRIFGASLVYSRSVELVARSPR